MEKILFLHKVGDKIELGRVKGSISVGNAVYKLSSKKLTQSVQNTYQSNSEYKKIKLSSRISIRKDQPVCLTIQTDSAENGIHSIQITTDIFPEKSENKPLTKEKFLTQFKKTGNSLYEFENITIDLDPDLFLKISDMNQIRRQSLEELNQIRIDSIQRTKKEIKPQSLPSCSLNPEFKIALCLNTLFLNKDYLELSHVDRLYIPFHYFLKTDYQDFLCKLCHSFSVYLSMPSIVQKNYQNLLAQKLDKIVNLFPIKGFILSSLGQFSWVQKYHKEIIAGHTFNVFNSISASELYELGFNTVTLSPELNQKELLDLIAHLPKELSSEFMVYGRLPLMTSHYCLIGKSNTCNLHSCNHACQKKTYQLKDRLGYPFPLRTDPIDMTTTIYNSKITSVSPKDVPTSFARIDILDESLDQIKKIITATKKGVPLQGKDYTKGNLHKQV